MVGVVGDLTSAYKETAEAMGLTISEEQNAVIDGLNAGLKASVTILGALAAAIAAINVVIKTVKKSNPELLIATAILGAIIAAVSVINKLSLAKYNNEIKKHEAAIKQLDREYKKLDGEIKKLSGTAYIKGVREQYDLLLRKIIETQAKLEAAKKKNKREEVEAFQDEIDDLTQQSKDLKSELTSKIAGTDITSAADSFASSWLDAYLSFGNTADAIENEFKDMMKNMVVNTMLSEIINTALIPVYKMIDDYSKDGFNTDEIKLIFDYVNSIIPGLDAALTATIGGISSMIGDLYDKESNLSGLSKGIAGASEETVGILAGYMDSIRFRLFAYIDYMMASGQGNTMSSLMQAQTTQIVHLANIDANTLRSAIANEDLTKEVKKLISVGSKGAYALNVNI